VVRSSSSRRPPSVVLAAVPRALDGASADGGEDLLVSAVVGGLDPAEAPDETAEDEDA
jgi:hypothetical protein